MPDPSQTSELEAINAMLETIGESPVSSTDDSGSVSVETALQILARTSRRVQEKGWNWNTSEDLALSLDTEGNVYVPENTLKVEPAAHCRHRFRFTQRGNRLYNKKTNSFTFTDAPVVTLVEFLAFDDMPEAARQYVALAASRVFQDKMVGSQELASAAGKDEQLAWIDLFTAEADAGQHNIFSSDIASGVLAR